MSKEDKAWSIEHEGPLNKNNLIFREGLAKEPTTNNNDLILNLISKELFYIANDSRVRDMWKYEIGDLVNNCLIVTIDNKDYPTNLNNLIRWICNKERDRLDIGANTYGEFVPITECECKPTSRDNLAEALDELLDNNVYLAAAILGDKYTEIQPLLEKQLVSLLTSTVNLAVLYKSTQQRLTLKGDNNE